MIVFVKKESSNEDVDCVSLFFPHNNAKQAKQALRWTLTNTFRDDWLSVDKIHKI